MNVTRTQAALVFHTDFYSASFMFIHHSDLNWNDSGVQWEGGNQPTLLTVVRGSCCPHFTRLCSGQGHICISHLSHIHGTEKPRIFRGTQ